MLKKLTIIACVLALHGLLIGSNIKPAYSSGAVLDDLVAYWSFDRDTVDIKKEAVDVFGGLVAVVKGDPELAPAADCKVGECILLDGAVDYLLVEDSNPATIDREWKEITLECWVFINALDDSWNRLISLDNMPANTSVASLYYDDDDNRNGFFVRAGGLSADPAKDDVQEDIPTEEWLQFQYP